MGKTRNEMIDSLKGRFQGSYVDMKRKPANRTEWRNSNVISLLSSRRHKEDHNTNPEPKATNTFLFVLFHLSLFLFFFTCSGIVLV